ncbi:hypothetical protein NA56DRAFT_641196 [Hyaloscypha hepaticicola]|uniref:ER membrane protein complex subunit 7 beta-sandwich domain-containing protein n=1 Tax=Hyaloscypha hepaticicola TaxID=2082293 RepID=A0A2J6QJP7_9HELO|nr:hypothetical protein NA56DRAFT_641196 [Hyaloscypha hepaticicola]
MRVSNLITLLVLPLALAIHIRVSIPSSQQLPHPNSLPASTHATLTTISNTYSAPLRADNTFDFRNVSSGSYLLDVHCHTHTFAPLRVDVREVVIDEVGSDKEVNVWGTFRGNEWNNKGEAVQAQKEEGTWTFGVKVQGGKDYFIERAGFSPLGLLKNPMILIAGFSMLIVFGMPYIMDNMDPELKAEFEERQKAQPNPAANPLQNFDAAAWLAGSTSSSSKKTEVLSNVERGITR